MKTFTRVLAGIILLAAVSFTVSDGMMTCFGLSRGIQYAFNFATLFIIGPASVIYLFDSGKEEVKL